MLSFRPVISSLCSFLLLALWFATTAHSSEVSLRLLPFAGNEGPPRALPERLHLTQGESLLLQLRLNQGLLEGEPKFHQLPEALTISKPAHLQAEQNSRQRIYLLTAIQSGSYPASELLIPTNRGQRKLMLPDIEVRKEFAGQALPLNAEKLFLSLASEKTQAYTGESFAAEAILHLPLGIHGNRLRYSMPSFAGSKIVSQNIERSSFATRTRMINGARYMTLHFPLQLTVLQEQAKQIGPVQLQLDFVHTSREGPSFASNQRTKQYSDVLLESASIPLEVLPLPANAPPSFRGAVGQYQLSLHNLQPRQPRFGDPLYLELSVSGKGNLDLVQEPQALENHNWKIELISQTTVRPEPITRSSFPQFREDARREFLLVLRPQAGSAAEELPVLGFTFFNPLSEVYETQRLELPPLPADYFLSAQENALASAQVADSAAAQSSTKEAQKPASLLLSPALSSSHSTPFSTLFSLHLSSQTIQLTSAGLFTLFLLSGLLWRVHWQQKHSPQARLLRPLRQAKTRQQASEALRQLHQLLSKSTRTKPHALQQLLQAQQQLEETLYQPQTTSQKAFDKAERQSLLALAKQTLPQSAPSPKKVRAQGAPLPPKLLPALALLLSPYFLPKAEAQEPNQTATSPLPVNEISPASAITPITPVAELPQLAWDAYQAENWQLAYQLWSQLGQNQGFSDTLCTHLGNAAFELQRPAEASLWFRRALLQNPIQKEATRNLTLAQDKLSLADADNTLLQRERWQHYFTPVLHATARISWWLAATLLITPLLWKRKSRLPWWITASTCLFLSLGCLVLGKAQLSHGITQERFVLLSPSPLLSAPVSSSQFILSLPAGQSCRILSKRGSWLFVEFPHPQRLRYPQRGWLRQNSGELLWPPPAASTS